MHGGAHGEEEGINGYADREPAVLVEEEFSLEIHQPLKGDAVREAERIGPTLASGAPGGYPLSTVTAIPRILRMHVRGTMLALTSSIVIAASPHSAIAQQSRNLPTPASILGFEPGADRHLPSWKQITDYFTALDKASPRVTVRTIGKTVLGRPFVVAIISDSSTLANLEHYRQIQRKLMDPRLQAAGERDKLLAEGKNVILVTSAIHSTESGGFTTPLVLADRLARAADPEAKEILANSIILMVPSQNPDGVDIVGDYYRSTLGTANEGREPPELYHHTSDTTTIGIGTRSRSPRRARPSIRSTRRGIRRSSTTFTSRGRTPAASSSRRTWIRSSRTSTRS